VCIRAELPFGLSSLTNSLGIIATNRRGLAHVFGRLRGSAHPESARHRLALGTWWAFVAAVTSQTLAIATSVAAARLLGKVQFGEFGMIQGTIAAFGVVAGGGLGMTATKHVAEYRRSHPDRAGAVIGLTLASAAAIGGAFALALLAGAGAFAAAALKAPHLAAAVRIGSVLLLANTIGAVQAGVLTGFEAFRALARLSAWRSALALPCTVVGLWAGGLGGALWGNVVALGVGAWLGHRALRGETARHGITIAYRAARREWRLLWSFSIPSLLSSALVGPVTWAAGLMLARQPNGYGELGVFSAGNQWRSALVFVPGLMGQVIVPVLASIGIVDQRARAARVLKTSILVCGACVVPLVLALWAAGGSIMALYGQGFVGRERVLQLSVLTAGLLAVQLPVGHLITASGRMWAGALMNLGWATVLLGGAWLAVEHGSGADGLALAYLIAYLAHSVWVFAFARRLLRSAPEMAPGGSR
jgi:O-antigen/teichoic acid export membrane protein